MLRRKNVMKLARIGLIMALLLTIGSPVNSVSAAPPKKPVTKAPALTGPQKVVWDYYAAYIAYQNYDLKKGDKTVKPVPNRTLDPSFVTQHFIDSYQKLMAEDKKTTPPGEVGLLDYDPIICGQDFPDTMAGSSVVLVNNTGTAATVKVGMAGFTPPAPPFIVKLKKLKQGWRIDAIVCHGKDFDSLYRAMKKQEGRNK
jgi:Protein of unknown function (DUF3828)